MNKPVKWFTAGGLLIISSISINVYPQDSISQPHRELLEFLGDWETDDGQWIDPIDFLEESSETVEQGDGHTLETNELPTDERPETNSNTLIFPQRKGSQHE